MSSAPSRLVFLSLSGPQEPPRDALDTLVLSTATDLGFLDELDGWDAQWAKHTANGKGRGGKQTHTLSQAFARTHSFARYLLLPVVPGSV